MVAELTTKLDRARTGLTAGVAAMQGELRGAHTNANSLIAHAGIVAMPLASCMIQPPHAARWRVMLVDRVLGGGGGVTNSRTGGNVT